MLKKKWCGLSIFIFALLCGCAATPPKQVRLIWPPPPEDPRVTFVKSFRGEGDFQKKSFWDSVFGAPSKQGLQKPYGVFASREKVYVALSTGSAVAVIDGKERKVTYIGERGGGRLSQPIGVAVASDGTVFVSDSSLNKVFGYDAQGTLKVAIGKKGKLKRPTGIAVNNALNRLYVVDTQGHTVYVYTLRGEPLFQFGRKGEENGEFAFPTNVAIDKRNGKVYVTDTSNFRVQVFDQDGKFLMKVGGVGDTPGAFTRPKGLGIDSEGNVYVADAAFNNVQMFDENGRLLLYFGGIGKSPGFFLMPAGLSVDEKDRVYVADSLNGRVQVFQYFSEKWKKENPEEYKKYFLGDTFGK